MTPIKLSALTRQLQQTIQQAFGYQTFWVMADITNYSFQSQKSYHYFDLVEKAAGTNNIEAKISASAWGTGNLRIRTFEKETGQKFTNNIHVLVKVAVEYHPIYGLKLTVLDLDSSFTIGKLEQQRQQTLLRILTECREFVRKEGEEYITRNKELELSKVIQRIAIVTSSTSAGLQDFQHTLDNNGFGYTFTIDPYYTTIQGEATSTAVVEKLAEIHRTRIPYDAIVIIRGGGAQTDFIIFDQFPLCELVARFPIPIITGIGHQKNETIVDLMAHTSTKTPTKAAEFIIAHNRAFEEQLLHFQKTILIRSQQLLSIKLQLLSRVNAQMVNGTKTMLNEKHREMISLSGQLSTKPKIRIAKNLSDIENLMNNIQSYTRINLEKKRSNIAHVVSVFRLMSPENILKKGFAIIKSNGVITSDPERINKGDQLSIILSNKEIQTIVTDKKEYHGREFEL